MSVFISVGISFLILIAMLAVLAMLRNRGFDPVTKLANAIVPPTPIAAAAQGTGA